MERRQRIVEVAVNEITFPVEEMGVVEAVVAAYHNGHTADHLDMFNLATAEEEIFVFDERYLGGIIVSGLRQAAAGRPARFEIFDLFDNQREQASQMIERFEKSDKSKQQA